MPIEATLLRDAPVEDVSCPNCGAYPIIPMMRGCVHRRKKTWNWQTPLALIDRPYCAVICEECKEIIAWEEPTRAMWSKYHAEQVRDHAREWKRQGARTIFVDEDGNALKGEAEAVASSAMMYHTSASCYSTCSASEPAGFKVRGQATVGEDKQ